MTGKTIRLNKLFSHDENAVVIAIDHGYMDGPIPGMINLNETVKKINPCVDGILLSPGMLKQLGHAFDYKGAPIPIVRLNWSTVFCFAWGYHQSQTVKAFSVADAAELGAEIVLISLTLQTGSEAQDAKNVALFAELSNEARKLGIPVIGECFPNNSNNLNPEQMHDIVYRGCRILAELGADAVKTFYTHQFKAVVDSCPIPILGLGGNRTPNKLDSLQLAKQIVDDGARGVVFGRNAIQIDNPEQYQKALAAVVKKSVDPQAALNEANL